MDAESQPGSHSSKRKRKLPAGMSEYQAAWIAEEDLDGVQESESDDEAAEALSQGGRSKRMPSGDGQSVSMPGMEDDDETDDMQVCTRLLKVSWPKVLTCNIRGDSIPPAL